MDKNTKITLAELIKRKERDCYKSTDKVACNRIGGNGKGR